MTGFLIWSDSGHSFQVRFWPEPEIPHGHHVLVHLIPVAHADVVALCRDVHHSVLGAHFFARDNLDWQGRELATVGALAAMPGAEPQLQSHVRISMNVGLTAAQLRLLADVLAQRGQPAAAGRAQAALDRQLAEMPAR